MGFTNFIVENFNEFLTYTGFANVSAGNLIMIAVGAFFIWLAIKKDYPCCSSPSDWVSSSARRSWWTCSSTAKATKSRSKFLTTTDYTDFTDYFLNTNYHELTRIYD